MKKFSKIILTMIMALQMALPQVVLADSTNVLYDFNTAAQQSLNVDTKSGRGVVSYTTGQYGKAADDASFKMSIPEAVVTDGNDSWLMSQLLPNAVTGDATNKFLHFSMEFIQEDTDGQMQVLLRETKANAFKEIVKTSKNGPQTVSVLEGAFTGTQVIGEWNTIDIYFEVGTSNVVVYMNDELLAQSKDVADVFNGFDAIRIWQEGIKYKVDDLTIKIRPTAMQFDNILVEAVADAPRQKIMMDFETDGQLTGGTISARNYVYGQYVKAKDDTSLRITTDDLGTAADGFVQNHFKTIPGFDSDKYVHFSAEFLHEDAKSGLAFQLFYNDEDNAKGNIWAFKTKTSQPTTAFMMFADANQQDATVNIGMWNKLDMYFERGTNKYTAFLNGKKYTSTVAGAAEINDFRLIRLSFERVTGVSSAIQFDNVYFEKVASVPEVQENWAIGEFFSFDDITAIRNANDAGYYVQKADGGNAFKVPVSGNPSAKFGQNYADTGWYNEDGTTANTIVSGVYGQPAWNKSLHSKFVKSDAQAGNITQGFHYNPSVTDLKPGDIGHLTFKFARVESKIDSPYFFLRIPASTAVYSDGSTNNALTNVFAMNGGVQFHGGQSTITSAIPKNRITKVDIIYKVNENNTLIDGYVDGVKVLSDFTLCTGKYLKYVGNLFFMSHNNLDYIIDDVGFRRSDAETMVDPAKSGTLTSSDTVLSTRIDNATKTIVLADSYTIADLKSKVNETIKVYDADGTELTEGTVASVDTIEVVSEFGGGVYYSIEDYAINETFDDTVKSLLVQEGAAGIKDVKYESGAGGKDANDKSILLGFAEGTEYVEKQVFVRANVGPYVGDVVSFEASAKPVKGESNITIGVNAERYIEYGQPLVTFMPNNEIRVMGNDIILDEKWIPGQWYKIAAVMEKDSKTIKVYLNGELVYDDFYVKREAEDIDYVEWETFSGFESLSHVSASVYNGAVCGFDDIRVGFAAYDSAVDLVTSKVDDVYVSNANSIIGFTDVIAENVTAETLKDLVTYDTLTFEDGKVFIRKGETIKYFTLGYKTQEYTSPAIEINGTDITATAERITTAKSTVNANNTTIIIAIYDEETRRLQKAVTDFVPDAHNATRGLSATIENCVSEGKYAVAYLWNMETMEPLKPIRVKVFDSVVSEN